MNFMNDCGAKKKIVANSLSRKERLKKKEKDKKKSKEKRKKRKRKKIRKSLSTSRKTDLKIRKNLLISVPKGLNRNLKSYKFLLHSKRKKNLQSLLSSLASVVEMRIKLRFLKNPRKNSQS